LRYPADITISPPITQLLPKSQSPAISRYKHAIALSRRSVHAFQRAHRASAISPSYTPARPMTYPILSLLSPIVGPRCPSIAPPTPHFFLISRSCRGLSPKRSACSLFPHAIEMLPRLARYGGRLCAPAIVSLSGALEPRTRVALAYDCAGRATVMSCISKSLRRRSRRSGAQTRRPGAKTIHGGYILID
jgi:hypothetical protein